MKRADRVPTRTPWGEDRWGYCRALRIGDRIEVSGTAAWNDDGSPKAPDDAEAQTREALAIIADALAELGADLGDVIRTRVYLTHIEDWEAVGSVHAEIFGPLQPVSTCIGIVALMHPAVRVEIEASAIVREA